MSKTQQSETQIKTDTPDRESAREERKLRPYAPPRVMSAEPLEAAAATCNPPTGGFGKRSPPTPGACTSLGS